MFRKKMDEILERNIAFTCAGQKTGTLLHILGIDGYNGKPVKNLELWKFPEESHAYLEACIGRDREKWSYRDMLEDDTIPTMKPFFGIAIHTAFVGGEVKFGGNTSYHTPMLDSLEEAADLQLSEENQYLQLLLDGMEYLKKRGEGEGFYASLRGGDSPQDIANALRGNDLFIDYYEEEENVDGFMEFCLKAARWTWEHQTAIIEPVGNGRISGEAVWMPGNSIGHLSEDASSLCSRAMYEQFGKPYTEQLLEDYDSTIVHVHTKGRHSLPAIAQIPQVKLIQLEYDPNEPSPIEVYKANIEVLKDKIIVPIMTTDEIEQNLDFLSQHKQIIQIYAKSMEDAQRAVNLVKSLR